MTILENISLKQYNTFGIEATARYFVEINSKEELPKLFDENKNSDVFILGGGSNLLFTQDIDKIVLKISIKGKELIEESDNSILLKIGAGENWHTLVEWCVQNNYAGIENLALIPGIVGAAPIQNIGAYGVEIKDVLVSLEWFDFETKKSKIFSNDECEFGYRDSIFKRELKGCGIISAVTLQLRKSTRALHTSYSDVLLELGANADTAKIYDVFNTVCAIRTRKLPNPSEIGNAGSFFKNPIISSEQYVEVKNNFPEIPSYNQHNSKVKIPAAWLIEQSGWKGFRRGDVGVYPRQALVLVNYGEASGEEIIALAREIQTSVQSKFGIVIDMEVNVL